MGWFDGLLGGGGGGGVDYAGLLSGGGNIDYNKLLQQELANADNAKWAALSGALAEAGMPSRLPVPIGSAIGKAAAAFGGGENNSLLKILQIQKLATETQNLKELSDLRKKLPDMYKGVLDGIIQFGGAPGAGQPNTPSGGGGDASGTVAGGGGSGGGTLTGEAIPIGQPGNPGSLAMEHAPETQEQVAKKIATTSGLQHWAGEWNPKLQADLQQAGLPLSGPVSEEQWNAAKPLILQRESMGGKNIPNYRFDATHTAGGPFQITNSTWKKFGGPDIATAANAAAAARPLPSAFDLPKFGGLLGGSTDAIPSAAEVPGGGGLLNPGMPSAELRGDASRVTTSLGPPGTYKINSKGQPYSPELETMPPDQKAKVAEAMRSIKERMLAGGGSGGGVPDIPPGDAGGGDGGGFLPGDLAAGLTPGQGPLAIPRPAGLPPMPAATAAPLGGLLAPPQAPVAPPAGPGLLATPQAPAAAPPQMRSGPSYAPQMPAGMNEQQMLALQVKIAQLRAQAALGGITGDPFGGLTDVLKNSPNAQRQKALIEQQMKYYGPDANRQLQRDLAADKAQLDIQKKLIEQGRAFDAQGNLVPIPGGLETLAKEEFQKAYGKSLGEMPAAQQMEWYKTFIERYKKVDIEPGKSTYLPPMPPPPMGGSVPGYSAPQPDAAPPAPPQGGAAPLAAPQRAEGGVTTTPGGGTMITGPMPKPPEGYEWYNPPDGGPPRQRPISGGKIAEAEQKMADFKKQSGNVVLGTVDRALNLIDKGALGTTGTLSGVARMMPGTNAFQLNEYLKEEGPILSNVGMDRLQAMRQTNPTGAGVGNPTEKEGARLAAIAGSLRQSQNADELRRNLFELHNAYVDAVYGSRERRLEAVKEGKITQQMSDAADREYYVIPPVPRPKSAGGPGPQSATPGGGFASQVPPGSRFVGTHQGNPVYDMPDGTRKVLR